MNNPSRLGRLTPRDTRNVAASSAAYSRVVGRLRWMLPTLVVLVLVGVWAWPKLSAIKVTDVPLPSVPNLMIEKLNLTGVDSKNRAYSLTADRALQAGSLKNMIDLEKPEGDIMLEDGSWITGRASKGRIEQATKKLWLGGEVELFHDQGYRFLTEEMNVDMPQSVAWGEKDVLFQGPFGEVRGKGFKILDAGGSIVIAGPASAKLSLRSHQTSDKPSVNHSTSR